MHMYALRDALPKEIKVAAQDYYVKTGAFTGEIRYGGRSLLDST